MHLGNLAVSGAGLLMTEQMAVEPEGRLTYSCAGLWSYDQVRALRPVFEFCRRYGGAKLGIQLGHAGRKGSVSVPWKGQIPLNEKQGAWLTPSPSPIPYPGRPRPTELDSDGLVRLRNCFAKAARNSLDLDADLLELHCAHGYLLHSFLTPLANKRIDRYGGSTQARTRFALEVFDAIREVWPSTRPLGVRVSATDWVDGGWTADNTVEFAAALKVRGCDYICASSGGASPDQRIPVGPGYQVPFAERIRREVGIPTMALGFITDTHQAENILSSGQADLIALGRGMLYNPRWAWHAAQELHEDVFFPFQYQRAHPIDAGRRFPKSVQNLIVQARLHCRKQSWWACLKNDSSDHRKTGTLKTGFQIRRTGSDERYRSLRTRGRRL